MPARRRFFMCRPDHFQIEYAINEWTRPEARVDRQRALAQWEDLLAAYRSVGVDVTVLAGEPGAPEMTFAGDSIFLFGDLALSSCFRHEERASEVAPMAERLRACGYRVQGLPEGVCFEGNAELLYWNGCLLGGYGVRSDRAALRHVAGLLGLELHTFELVRPFYHFDVCFTPLDASSALYYPGAFTAEGRARLARLCPSLFPVTEEEAKALACNSVAVHGHVVMSTRRAPRVAQLLEDRGKRVIELDLSEFLKAGGGAKCLTLEAYEPARARRAVA